MGAYVLVQTHMRAVCQKLSKFNVPRTFDLAVFLGIYLTYISCVENITDGDIYDSIVCDSREWNHQNAH